MTYCRESVSITLVAAEIARLMHEQYFPSRSMGEEIDVDIKLAYHGGAWTITTSWDTTEPTP